jgi:PhoH-like ATPase
MTAIAAPTVIIDTSVLLADPRALGRFGEAHVVLPVAVISELEAKRNHPELGWAAREALRELESLRTTHGSLSEPIPLGDSGGTLRVELNHLHLSDMPRPFSDDTNDHRILAVAHSLSVEGHDVTVVTKDLPLRLKASLIGLRASDGVTAGPEQIWSGVVECDVTAEVIDELYAHRSMPLEAHAGLPADLVVNAGVILRAGSQSALGRVTADGEIALVRPDTEMFGLRGRSAEQRIALDLLADPTVGIVSLGGSAGTGKSALALAAGLEAVMEARTHSRVLVFRPLFAVGGQELGFLPGTEGEKMSPWAAATFDVLESVTGTTVIDEIVGRGRLEVLPLTHIRGRSLSEAFVIIDEAQNLERPVLLTALSRLGVGCKVVLTHDLAQRDNLRVGRHDGVASVIAALRGHELFGHVTLRRSERGEIAALVTGLLEASLD